MNYDELMEILKLYILASDEVKSQVQEFLADLIKTSEPPG